MSAKKRKKKVKIKYKNLALVLAVLLLIILLFVWIFSPKDKPQDDTKDPVSTGDQNIELPDLPEENDGPKMTTDPTLQTSYVFTFIPKTEADLGEGTLVLVNNNIAYKGSVSEDELILLKDAMNKSFKVKDRTVFLRQVTIDNLNEMMLGFYTAKQNDDVMVISGHRTIEYQQDLYEKELAETGLETSTLVSRPGYSEHHTGYVVDFKVYDDDGKSYEFDGTGDYAWIMENCHNYGFINRYPLGKEKITLIDNEPWHFRYVGKVHAGIITEYDFCLEEYIEFLKNYTIDTGFLKTEADGKTYIIYYVPMVDPANTTVCIPLMADMQTPYPYEVSGNNIDGWIVTVDITQFGQTEVQLNPTPAVTEATEAAEDEPTEE